MDTKANCFAGGTKGLNHLFQWVLSLGDGETITWNDDDAIGLHQEIACVVNVGLRYLAFELHSLSLTTRLGAITAKDDTEDVTIHRVAHNFGQSSSATANESSHSCEDWHVEHESLCAQRPSRVTVEHSNDDRHVGSTDACSHVPTKHARGCQGASKCGKASACFRRAHNDCASSKRGCPQSDVDLVTRRMSHWGTAHATV
mmetsp:Transcript_5826/g.12343  ORF Transcript_5826/g.12343 Transcript_5826/m.12343 type:complete len:201 (-) Transcript_5826:2373-2975(-)